MYQKIELKGIEQQSIKRLSDNAYIPFDPDNTDYQAYLKWLEKGNEPLPANTTEQGVI